MSNTELLEIVGGASLKADSFNEIIANTMKVSV